MVKKIPMRTPILELFNETLISSSTLKRIGDKNRNTKRWGIGIIPPDAHFFMCVPNSKYSNYEQ